MLLLGVSSVLLILTRNNHQVLSLDFLVILGIISYPLYLWHYPLIAFSNIFEISTPILPFILLVLALFLGWVTYRFFEVYTRKITGRTPIILLTVMVICLGLIGCYFENTEGLPSRPQIKATLGNLKQLKRTPASDGFCDAIAAQAGIITRLFHYCRSTTKVFDASYVAVIGDSHAHAMFPGISLALKKNNIETLLLSNSSCPSFIGGEMGSTLKSVDKCAAMIEQIFNVLNRLPNLNKVIIVSRGPTYSEEKGFGEIESSWEKRPDKFRSYFANSHSYDAGRDYFSSLEHTIGHLTKQHKQVFLLLENPELGFSPQSCIDRPHHLFTKKCKVAFQTFQVRMKVYRDKINEIKFRNPALVLLDPAESLCDQEWCYAMKNGELLYADDDHLSVLGSQYVADNLIDKIVK